MKSTLCTCRTCGHRFHRAPSLIKARTYCDRACHRADRLPADEALGRIRASKREYARRKRAFIRAQSGPIGFAGLIEAAGVNGWESA